jgi:RNA polymerase sigma factor (sigma-70 family)
MTTVSAAQRGDHDAFAEIVVHFQHMAHSLAYRYVNDRHLAEDIAQEAFIEAYLCLPQLRAPLAFPAWFRRIVIKRADRITRRAAAQTLPLDLAATLICDTLGPLETVELRELSRTVRGALAMLPTSDQQALGMFYLHGSSVQEIASAIGRPTATVKKRLFDARRRLRRVVESGQLPGALQSARPGPSFSQAVQFFLAVRTGDTGRVAALLDREPALVHARELPAEVEARLFNPSGGASFTALHRATSMGSPELIELLLARGAECDARTRDRETALHLAVLYDWPAALERLLRAGADPNLATAPGMTALHWAVVRRRPAMAAALVSYGARTDLPDQCGRTALDWAILKGDEDAVMLLRGLAAHTPT